MGRAATIFVIFMGAYCAQSFAIPGDLSTLGLSNRTATTLNRSEIFSIGALESLTDEQLLRFPGMGNKGVAEIHAVLAQIGTSTHVPELRLLGLNTRAINSLRHMKITTLEDLKHVPVARLTFQIGEVTARHIVEILASNNIKLMDDDLHRAIAESNYDDPLSCYNMGFSSGLQRELERKDVKTIGQLLTFYRDHHHPQRTIDMPFDSPWQEQYDQLAQRLTLYIFESCQLRLDL